VSVLIDPPRWPAHGRTWSHLVSDASLAELHAFAARLGVPARAFSGDHYDVPAERYADALRAGAQAVEGKVLLTRLVASGLRVPKRRGERLLDSHPVHDWLPGSGAGVLDLIASPLPLPEAAVVARRLVAVDARWLLVVPTGTADGPQLRVPASQEPVHALRPVGFHRLRLAGHPAVTYSGPRPWAYVAYLGQVPGTPPPTPGPGTWVEVSDPRVQRLDCWPLVQLLLDGA
jgi:hypothetical protein